jgi:hypothetical protein
MDAIKTYHLPKCPCNVDTHYIQPQEGSDETELDDKRWKENTNLLTNMSIDL